MAPERADVDELPPCGCGTPGSADPATCYCGVDDLLRVIRRRYSLAVMNAIHVRGAARYHEVASALPQASSSTLAETLQALQTAQLITRRADIGYALTLSGSRLLSRLRNLLDEVHLS